ncbi:hypothetical protein PsYK624_118230 [Phanerochaete sordida]|uniref:Uncharacterized protein n=1 Tax=Phanerochaete sordida TaxID=48140 RepID=A0A9P3LIX6_9APHY|nr:hypothetical protein PsYK624_118230 [Phanerochaete sordida]
MTSCGPVLPPEIVHKVISHVIARHLDDCLVGSLSSPVSPFDTDHSSRASAPIVALLVASCQMRQTTLIILSSAFGIPLSRVGLWRLEERPWPVLESIRRLLRRELDFNTDKHILIRLMSQAASPEREPPIPSVYVYTHVLDEISARPFKPVVLPVPGRSAPFTADQETTVQLFERYVKIQFAACPAAFQEVLFMRLQHSLAESAVSRIYGAVISSVYEAWEELEAFAKNLTSETSPGAFSAVDGAVSELMDTLGKMHAYDREVRHIWPFAVPLDVVIGVARFNEWIAVFEIISGWAFDAECAERLRAAADDFYEEFCDRALELERLQCAQKIALAEHADIIERESYTAISDS